MSLQDIIQKIAADNEAEIEKIEAKTAEQKKQLDADASKSEAEALKALGAKTEAALQSVDAKTTSMARRENAQGSASVKRKGIDTAMGKLLDSLEKSDDKTYQEIVSSLVKSLPFSKGTMLVPASRLSLMKDLAGDFELESDDKMGGGFIARDGKAEVDNTFKNLVRSVHASELEIFIASQLKLV